jgi:hypothetical protein
MQLWSLLADDAVAMAGVLGLVSVVPLLGLRIIRLALIRARAPVATGVAAGAAAAISSPRRQRHTADARGGMSCS